MLTAVVSSNQRSPARILAQTHIGHVQRILLDVERWTFGQTTQTLQVSPFRSVKPLPSVLSVSVQTRLGT